MILWFFFAFGQWLNQSTPLLHWLYDGFQLFSQVHMNKNKHQNKSWQCLPTGWVSGGAESVRLVWNHFVLVRNQFGISRFCEPIDFLHGELLVHDRNFVHEKRQPSNCSGTVLKIDFYFRWITPFFNNHQDLKSMCRAALLATRGASTTQGINENLSQPAAPTTRWRRTTTRTQHTPYGTYIY